MPRLRRISHFAWGAALLAVVGFAIELVLWNQPLVAARLLKFYWFRLTDVAAPLAVTVYAVALIVAGIERRRIWSVWALAGALALAGWHLVSTSVERYVRPIPPADAKMRDYAAWVDACEWIAENTPPNALFLTPKAAHSFKWRTGRPEVVTRKDIPQDARSMVEWFRRMQDIHGEVGPTDGAQQPASPLSDPTTERIRRIAETYDAQYILTDRRIPLGLPAVYPRGAYSNTEYVVYRID